MLLALREAREQGRDTGHSLVGIGHGLEEIAWRGAKCGGKAVDGFKRWRACAAFDPSDPLFAHGGGLGELRLCEATRLASLAHLLPELLCKICQRRLLFGVVRGRQAEAQELKMPLY